MTTKTQDVNVGSHNTHRGPHDVNENEGKEERHSEDASDEMHYYFKGGKRERSQQMGQSLSLEKKRLACSNHSYDRKENFPWGIIVFFPKSKLKATQNIHSSIALRNQVGEVPANNSCKKTIKIPRAYMFIRQSAQTMRALKQGSACVCMS